MQTFLIDFDLVKTAKILDNKRLGKQRVEAYQILSAITGYSLDNGGTPEIREKIRNNQKILSKAWTHHPATLMWKDSVHLLRMYYNIMIQEWIDRGFNNTMQFAKVNHIKMIRPRWMYSDLIYETHKSNLLRKDYNYYSSYFLTKSDLPYYWPKIYDKNVKEVISISPEEWKKINNI